MIKGLEPNSYIDDRTFLISYVQARAEQVHINSEKNYISESLASNSFELMNELKSRETCDAQFVFAASAAKF